MTQAHLQILVVVRLVLTNSGSKSIMSTRQKEKRRQRPNPDLVDIVDIEYLIRDKEKIKSTSYETSAIVDIHETRKGNMGVSYSYATQEVTRPRVLEESADAHDTYHQETFTFLESNIFMAEPGELDHLADDACVQGAQETAKESKKRVNGLRPMQIYILLIACCFEGKCSQGMDSI